MAHQYDVVIIGSGVAGALVACRLATHGYRILILEAGDNGYSHGQRLLFHHTMDVQGNRGDMFAPYKDLEANQWARSPEGAQRELEAQRADKTSYYRYSAESKHAFKAGYNRLVGGSTWSWRGNCPRFLPSDFKLKSQFDVGRDWPVDYDELEPWYCEAESELGVSGNHNELAGLFGAHRSLPFPMAGIPPSYGDQVVKKKLDGEVVDGTRIHVVTTPQARNSSAFNGRPACEGHSNCIPLCPIGAKYDATTHLRRALAMPNVELRTSAVVTKLVAGEGGRVAEVQYRDWRRSPDQTQSVSGGVIVLAAHAIETPKLLLLSDGLANRSGHVGCNLMDHVQFEAIGLYKEPLYPFRGPQSVVSIEDFRDGPFRRERSAFRMTVGNDGWGRSGSPATIIEKLLAKGVYGSALPGEVAKEIPRMGRLGFSTEMLPEKRNRIIPSTSAMDSLGIPQPEFTFDIGSYAEGGLRAGLATAKKLLELAGADFHEERPLEDPITGRMNWNTAAHIMGTCIMGSDPTDSVVDRWGRSHDVSNLWIVGSSVFATSATANPTLTLAALALRTSAAIRRQLLNGALE